MEINIRKAIPEDAYNFTVCHISCWQSAYKNIVSQEYLENMLIEKEKQVEKYKNTLANQGDCKYYCVMCSERMIGFIIINKGQNEDKSIIGEIWAIYLLEEFCGKNIGKILLDFAINELKCIEPIKIFLWVFEENHRARHFYEKNNFNHNGIKREVAWYGKPLIQLQYIFNNKYEMENIIEITDSKIITDILNKAFMTVALQFNFTKETVERFPAFMESDIIDNQLKNGLKMYGYNIDNKIVGCGGYSFYKEQIYIIERLGTLPEYRHIGIGKKLIAFLESKIKESGGKIAEIHVIDINEILVDWYKSMNYKQIRTDKLFDGKRKLPFNSCVMNKELS